MTFSLRFEHLTSSPPYLTEGGPTDAPDRVSLNKDGRFEIRGLPAPKYVVQIRLEKRFAVKRFEVPLHSTSPVDLGEIPMQIN